MYVLNPQYRYRQISKWSWRYWFGSRFEIYLRYAVEVCNKDWRWAEEHRFNRGFARTKDEAIKMVLELEKAPEWNNA